MASTLVFLFPLSLNYSAAFGHGLGILGTGKLSREPSNWAFFATPSRVSPIVRLSVKSLREVWVSSFRSFDPCSKKVYAMPMPAQETSKKANSAWAIRNKKRSRFKRKLLLKKLSKREDPALEEARDLRGRKMLFESFPLPFWLSSHIASCHFACSHQDWRRVKKERRIYSSQPGIPHRRRFGFDSRLSFVPKGVRMRFGSQVWWYIPI